MTQKRLLLGKIYFQGNIVIKTGLHIGGSNESMQIGGVDLPIIRDSASNLPYIPGSSLKGKLRSTVEKVGTRSVNGKIEKLENNRNIGTFRNQVNIHCCEDFDLAITCDVCRIFGSSGDDRSKLVKKPKAENMPSALLVRDCLLDSSIITQQTEFTEVKTETGIDRKDMSANPRRVERVLPDSIFNFEMIYAVEIISKENKDIRFNAETVKKDLQNILAAMSIIEDEALGGYSSRGYGKIKFNFSSFFARSLDYYYTGDDEKNSTELQSESFDIKQARSYIDEIINFLKEASSSVLAY